MTALRLEFVMIEGQNLLHLVEEFIDLLVGGRDTADAGLERLAPNAYPEDDESAAAFRAATRVDLLDRRVSDALDVRAALAPFDRDDVEPLAAAAMVPHEVTIPAGETDAWLRTLSAMRLVVAARLGVDHADAHDPEDQRFHVYDWLGYRLDQLVQLADEQDAAGSTGP
ncbi:DUF2017 family protein [Microbacterium sp. H1-D42]|uniref:DUF2017 family protein n=1 Tax=Microbacterium sp. H1-D42 TaxID=2925844 RepID=UPI001F537210|nr:DUF2017 family protein [Microbacterium sp. H1-D42]UNK69341.1 DUF2017 domain-containing protein [Microbacterium sp. H1-D42]